MACSAGVTFGQVHGGPAVEAQDPTPESTPYCDYHLYPNSASAPLSDVMSPIGWLRDTKVGFTSDGSWVNHFPNWTPARRPMMTLQPGSGSYTINPCASLDDWYPVDAERLKRWYSVGDIRVVDFNGDGIVNESDYTMANAAIDRSIDYSLENGGQIFPAVFGNGDIDGSGIIDEYDRWLFNSIYWQAHLSGQDWVHTYIVNGELHANHDY